MLSKSGQQDGVIFIILICYLTFHSFSPELHTVEFSRGCVAWDIAKTMNAEQLSSIKPDLARFANV